MSSPSRRSGRAPRRTRDALIPILLLLLLAQAACTRPPGRRVLGRSLSAEQRVEAQAGYERLQGLVAAGQNREAQTLAYDLLDRFPRFEAEDHVLLLGGQASLAQDDTRAAQGLFDELTSRFPASPHATDAWWALAVLHEDSGAWLSAAEGYTNFWEHTANDALAARARARLKELIDQRLDLDELEQLRQGYGDTVIGSYVTYTVATRRFEAGDESAVVGPVLEDFLTRYPESRYREDVERMLAEIRIRGDYEGSPGIDVAMPDRIGILCPLTGEYAALGQAMYNGALLALEEHNRRTGESFTLISLDTQGDGVRTVLATRSFIEKEGVVAVIGGLLSPTTIAAAAVCQERGVPLISPTATQESISQLGDYVFQTNLTRSFEARLLARVAVTRLLKRRLAILYPDTEEGRAAAHLFARDAETHGARVVASEPYERGTTDFREPLSRIRQAGPEAIFIPTGPSEMRLIAPQLTFYKLEAQLLGPSSWDNARLAREVGDDLDRAIFTSDSALMPQAEQDRFASLWLRRYHEEGTNPFGLKTYHATQRVLTAMSAGARSRRALQQRLSEDLVYRVGGEGPEESLRSLRLIEDGKIEDFPFGIFPSLQAESSAGGEEEPQLEDEFEEPGLEESGRED